MKPFETVSFCDTSAISFSVGAILGSALIASAAHTVAIGVGVVVSSTISLRPHSGAQGDTDELTS